MAEQPLSPQLQPSGCKSTKQQHTEQVYGSRAVVNRLERLPQSPRTNSRPLSHSPFAPEALASKQGRRNGQPAGARTCRQRIQSSGHQRSGCSDDWPGRTERTPKWSIARINNHIPSTTAGTYYRFEVQLPFDVPAAILEARLGYGWHAAAIPRQPTSTAK